ncbi:hypothetical protein COOONC_17921 [Cooperia oncophora]
MVASTSTTVKEGSTSTQPPATSTTTVASSSTTVKEGTTSTQPPTMSTTEVASTSTTVKEGTTSTQPPTTSTTMVASTSTTVKEGTTSTQPPTTSTTKEASTSNYCSRKERHPLSLLPLAQPWWRQPQLLSRKERHPLSLLPLIRPRFGPSSSTTCQRKESTCHAASYHISTTIGGHQRLRLLSRRQRTDDPLRSSYHLAQPSWPLNLNYCQGRNDIHSASYH